MTIGEQISTTAYIFCSVAAWNFCPDQVIAWVIAGFAFIGYRELIELARGRSGNA